MRSKGILAFVILLFCALFVGCAGYVNTQSTNDVLCGTWNWKSTAGGITGRQVTTPETSGHTKQIRFSPDGVYQEFLDDSLVIVTGYAVVRKKTIFGFGQMICFSDTGGRLPDQVIMKVTATSLSLSDPYPDGYCHGYARVEGK